MAKVLVSSHTAVFVRPGDTNFSAVGSWLQIQNLHHAVVPPTLVPTAAAVCFVPCQICIISSCVFIAAGPSSGTNGRPPSLVTFYALLILWLFGASGQ